MTTKYLEIDSTFRDRNSWPLPGSFQVLLSQSSAKTAATAMDPVSLATPVVSWQSNRFRANTTGSISITGTVTSVGYGANNTTLFIVFTAPAGQLSPIRGYYNHVVLSAAGNVTSRVTSYEYLGNNEARVYLKESVNLPAGTSVTLTDGTDLSVSRIFVPTSPDDFDNFYAKMILYDESVNLFTKITWFDKVTGAITVADPIPGWTASDSFSIRQEPPLFVGIANVTSTASMVVLGPNANVNLIGSFIRIDPVYPAIPPSSEIRRIISYNPTTTIATTYPAFTASPAGFNYEILPFNYDNFNPFVYTGSLQNEFNTCSVRLVNLVLPTAILNVGYGGRISDYPYVYVELTPLNTTNNNVSSSNNPNSTRTLFRATKQFDQPTRGDDSPFIRFTGYDTIQRVKFRVENDFSFSVTLPNGQIFETHQIDNASPQRPNPLIQISASFEIIRW
jgi:hypothetical protein